MGEPESRVLRARDVYLLMKKDYRISRNIRASWFFQHLNTKLEYSPSHDIEMDEGTTDELQLVSMLPDDGTLCAPGEQYSFMLLPSTIVTFIARRYRFVIILDLSPSVASVDLLSNEVLYDQIQDSLGKFLKGLVRPFSLPGSCAMLSPEIYITVIAYTPVKTCTFNQVLSQGMLVNEGNVNRFLSAIKEQLTDFETSLAQGLSGLLETASNQAEEDLQRTPGENSSPGLPKNTDIISSAEAGIVNMLRLGLLALQLLPENSSSGLVVITDGCLGVPDANLFEFLLTQLRTSTTACSFLCIGSDNSPAGQLGHVPHVEFMQFLATATSGSYFPSCPSVDTENQLNLYHRAMFLWNFQKGLEDFHLDLIHRNHGHRPSSPTFLLKKLLSHPVHGKVASVMPTVRKRHTESKLNTSLFSILCVRMREGYTIKEIAITKGDTQIEVRLVLPWREYASFEYVAMAAWPLDKSKSCSHIEITLEGSYDFLHDMTCTQLNTRMLSQFRTANVRKFWLALQGLSQTDQLLVHLQSFSTNPVYYNLPESIKKGVPLFYLPHNTAVPALSTQLNNKDATLSQFASFWRPVVNLDIKVWQKWMHTHRIGIVLEHDVPLHKNLHIPNSSGRFSFVQCRQAMISLTLFLKEWSTFVLLDNQSYVKLIQDDADQPPTAFFLLRITSKPPCLVLRIAFLGGTPGYRRHEVVKELKQKLSSLKFPQRGAKTDKTRRTLLVKRPDGEGQSRKAPLLREWADVFCCVLLAKPVENILIRYERKPKDLTKLDDQLKEMLVQWQAQAKNKSAVNLFNSLSRYLLHHRWIWTVQQPSVSSISMQAVGRILSTLTKIRIQQGFHFGVTNSGVVNMVLEVDMHDPASGIEYSRKNKQRPTCVVQYLLFPPHIKTTYDSSSDDSLDEMETTEADGELQIVTECWIEPQTGVSINNSRERQQLDGLTCHQIPQTFFPVDQECVSSLVSFEHLMYLCHNNVLPADLSSLVNSRDKGCLEVNQLAPTIEHIQFPFDLLSLLSRSQQAEIIYPSFAYDPDYPRTPECQRDCKEGNSVLFSLLFEKLQESTHQSVCLTGIQSKRFLHHLQTRPRDQDTNPFPFPLAELLARTDNPDSRGNNSADSKAAESSNDNVDGLENGCPEWKCFIKAISATCLIVTVLPASFEDVILLNERLPAQTVVTEEEEVEEGGNIVAGPGAGKEESVQAVDVSDDQTTDGESSLVHSDKTVVSDVSGHLECEDVQSDQGDLPLADTPDVPKLEVPPLDTGHTGRSEGLAGQKDGEADQVDSSSVVTLVIPVYVYDCMIHNVLDSLINPWDFQLPADKYEDMTFDPYVSSALPGAPEPQSPRRKRVSFSLDSMKGDDVEESGSHGSGMRSQERRSTEGSSEGRDILLQHCDVMSEVYFSCFVRGIFQSLQKGITIHACDVDAAINNICEESFLLETSITSFLHASCGHLQQLVNEARKEEQNTDHDNSHHSDHLSDHHGDQTGSDEIPRRTSVRFTDIMDETDGDVGAQSKPVPEVLQIPHACIKLDLPSLHLNEPCEPAKGLHSLIKNKFVDMVQKWFRPIPSYPDYYFYCPERPVTEDLSDERETTVSDAMAGLEESAEPECDTEVTLGNSMKGERISTTSLLDSDESMVDENDLDLEMTMDDISDQVPLFIFFTCTIKSRLDQYSVPLRSVAACLGELSPVLENLSEVDLGDLKITFDLNCLSLPNDSDFPSPRKPPYIRALSNSSTGESSLQELDHEDRWSSHMSFKHGGTMVGHLAEPQLNQAVRSCMAEIEWLLRDEMVSDLRLIQPIRGDALHYVTQHVQLSTEKGKANTNADSVPLQFVFGAPQSLSKFSEEFEKMILPSYQLVKEADWYYLAKRRVIPTNFVNAIALSSALTQLSKDGSKSQMLATSPKFFSPGSRSEVEALDDSKHSKNLSPLVLNQSRDKTVCDSGPEMVATSSPLTGRDGGRGQEEAGQTPDGKDAAGDKLSSSGQEAVPQTADSGTSVERLSRRRSREISERDSTRTGDSPSQEYKNITEAVYGKVARAAAETRFRFPSGPLGQLKTNETLSQSGSSGAERRRSSDLSDGKHSGPGHELLPLGADVTQTGTAEGHTDTAKFDVSIQLTKTDGRSEPFRPSPDRPVCQSDRMSPSFEDEYDDSDGVLKRCSSFAGFKSERPCVESTVKQEGSSQSPVKGIHISLSGPLGRLRHFSAPSGQGTPRSKPSTLPQTPSWISSRGSFTEDAYDGDMSEIDDSATSFSESSIIQRLMPNFWLVMQVSLLAVDIFYQRRESWKDSNETLLEQRSLLTQVKKTIDSTCRKVNQLLLLNDLYDTRMCHALLVPEADEEVSWKIDSQPKPKLGHALPHSSSSEGEEDDGDACERKYLAAAMDLSPGFFDCDCKWRTSFSLHPRLKSGSGRSCRGVQAMRTFLNPFSSVNNRRNMFVIREKTGAVFYLKLQETGVSQRQLSVVSGDENFLTESMSSASGLGGGRREGESGQGASDRDADTISINSSSSALSLSGSQRLAQDRVDLLVHGIEEPGPEIKEDLVRVLQNRLDETTLDIISVMLRRNPVCKLMYEDVMFIQPPASEATDHLYLTVPSRAGLQLPAVIYYLRQNLLQFLHTPNYVDNKSENHFMATVDGVRKPIPSDRAFLYIHPQTTGKTGIAFLSVALVDGQGNQVNLLPCLRPSHSGHDQIETQIELEMFVSTQIYEAKPGKRPGPTALIHFSIWERGSVDLKALREKLFGAMKHALCDVVMEYYILTAPLCEVPKHLLELPPPPTLSAPSSPLCVKAEEYRERKYSMVMPRKVSDTAKSSLERRQSLQSHSALQSLRDTLLASKKLRSPPPDTSKAFDIPDRSSPITLKAVLPDPQAFLSQSDPQTIARFRYENGERGTLHRIYTSVLEEWLQYCFKLGDPAVSWLDLTLKSRFSTDFVLQEFQNIISNITKGMTTRLFKLLSSGESDEPPTGFLYNPNRAPFEGRHKSETSLDWGHSVSFSAGEDLEFVAVSRDVGQWYTCIQHAGEEETSQDPPPRGKQAHQKFQAYTPVPDKSGIGIFSDPPSFIPRQAFVLLTMKNKKISMYTYNWSNELSGALSKYMTRLVHWHNARCHLLVSIVTQKMGLYNHFLFSDLSTVQETNPFTQNAVDTDTLIRHAAPTTREGIRRTNSMTITVREPVLSFDVTFKDLHPAKPLHASYLANQRDPMVQYGLQALDIRRDFKREFDKITNIRNLYVMWVQKTAPNYPISEDVIKTLKQSSRLFHYCATPLLFWRAWRDRVLEKYRVTRQDSVSSAVSTSTADTKSRSRHSSGTSTGSARAKRADSQEGRKRLGKGGPSQTSDSMESLNQDVPIQEENWHLELRANYMSQYIKYLQTNGFHLVQMRQGSPARKGKSGRSHDGVPTSEDSLVFRPFEVHNLQKTVSGGVLLIELSFRDEYFCVKLYTCDHNKLGITVNQQMKLLFVDECEKCKNMIHVHSFAHDFHLRCIQTYISGQQQIFQPGYHLTSLLTDFKKVYPYAPSFSRNFLQHDIVTIPKPSCSSQQLYDYMLTHAKLHSMRVLRMIPPLTDTDTDFCFVRSDEHALVSHEVRDLSANYQDGTVKKENYNIGLVIIQEPNSAVPKGDKSSLQLQYFIVLTSSRELFPRHSLEKNLGVLMSKARLASGEESGFHEPPKEPMGVTHFVSIRHEATDYLGYSNTHQPPIYQVLKHESQTVREKIEKMAVVSMEKCRRDSLWHRLLIDSPAEEDSKKKKRSDTEETKDMLSRLSYAEFLELLDRVHKLPLHEIDSRLVPFLHMSLSWYQSLAQTLSHKYQDVRLRRCFVSPEGGHVQYHVILNPKFLDTFMMLHIDNTMGHAGLCAVNRKPVKEQESSMPPGQNITEQSIPEHMEHFINVCCFQLWSSIL